jgi:hypothetical protein
MLNNGVTYQWYKKDLYDNYDIKYIDKDNKELEGCVWDAIGSENKKTVLATKPKDYAHPLFEQGTAMYHKFLHGDEELRKTLIENLGDDISCVYTISEDRKKLIKTYFDCREGDDEFSERDRLFSDPSDLIHDIHNGNTVVFVFGSSDLYERYFVKVGVGEECTTMQIEVKYHYNN